ncbi:unnamed protein product, partial [Hapterophycus canaliculatus]
GIFQSVVNLLIQESGKIEPVIGEVQGADLPQSILDDQNVPNGTVTVFYAGNENNPAQQVSTSIEDFVGQSSFDTINFVSNAIVQLNDQVDSTADLTVSAGVRAESSIFEYRVTYSATDLAGLDIPRLITVLEIDNVVQNIGIIEDNVVVNGTFNPEALKGNLEVFTRNS